MARCFSGVSDVFENGAERHSQPLAARRGCAAAQSKRLAESSAAEEERTHRAMCPYRGMGRTLNTTPARFARTVPSLSFRTRPTIHPPPADINMLRVLGEAALSAVQLGGDHVHAGGPEGFVELI